MKVKILSTGGYSGMKNAVGKIVEIDDFEEGKISAEELIRVGADQRYFINGESYFFAEDELELVKNGSKFNVGDVVTININYVLSSSHNNFFGISKDSVCRRFNLNFKIVEVNDINPEPTYMFENSGFYWPESILKLVTTNTLTFAEKYKIGDKIKLNTDYVFDNREEVTLFDISMRDLFKYLNKTLIIERVDEDDETVKTDAWFWLKEEMFVKCDE